MNCTHCRRPMRPHGVRLAAQPDTVGYGARGFCSGCYKQAGTPAAAERAEADAPANRGHLEAWLQARRVRLGVMA